MNRVIIVMYHYVRELNNSRYKNIKGLDLKLFKQQIEFFKSNFNIISTCDIEKLLDQKKSLPPKSLLLTFDDGYIDHYTNVFPILRNNNISGVFSIPAKIIAEKKVLDVNKIHFVLASGNVKEILNKIYKLLDYYRGKEFEIPSNEELYNEIDVSSRFDSKEIIFIKRLLQYRLPVRLRKLIINQLFKEYVTESESIFCDELYMNYDQIKVMKKNGMEFGIHGYDHSWLGELPYDDMKNDILKALNVYKNLINKDNWIMCAPYGSYNNKMIEFIKSNGCKLGFGTEVGIADLEENNKYKLPRLDTNDFPPKSENFKKFI